MKTRELLMLLGLALGSPACSGAPIELPSDDTPQEQTGALTPAVPASFWTTSAPGVTAGYAMMPGGDQVAKQCIFLVKPGDTPTKRPPCPVPAIKAKRIAVKPPVQPNTILPPSEEPSFEELSLNNMISVVTDYHSQPNLGWKSQYNIVGFKSDMIVPNKPTYGTAPVYIMARAEKWGGQYPQMTRLYEAAGVIFQWGNNGMWGGALWSMFTYAQDAWGNYNVAGPWYDLAPGSKVTFEGHAAHITVPYWGPVTEWTLTANGAIPLKWWYPEPFDFNFFNSSMDWVNATLSKRRDAFPASDVQWLTHVYANPHGCTPGDVDYPLPWWWCLSNADATPNWVWMSGNGGGLYQPGNLCSTPCPAGQSGHVGAAIVPGGEPYDYNFVFLQ